jgi:hypothetical protein
MQNYPLTLAFKLIAIAPQITVSDAGGRLVMYVKQRAFKLKEDVRVFADREQTRELYRIAADRVIDWSAQYDITSADGRVIGAVKRRGMRSLWRAHYDLLRGGGAALTIQEGNAWVKVLDGLLGELPFVGVLTGYLFNPSYVVADAAGRPLLRVVKRRTLFESRFTIVPEGTLSDADEELALLGVMMMTLLERSRG